MVFRVEKNKNYTTMSNYHLREKEMSLKAKGLLSWMLSNDDDWDYSIAGIVANCKENETAIKSALDELQEFGYLKINKLMPESRITENGNKEVIRSQIEYEYIVYEQPHENQDIENLCVENQVQRNTKTRNTNKENTNTKVLVEAEKPKKKNLYEKCIDVIDEFTDDTEIKELLVTYLKMRLEVKDKPLYINQFKGMINKLKELTDDTISVIQQSIDRGYLSFYPLSKNNNVKSAACENNVKSVRMTETEKKQQEDFIAQMKKEGRKIEF